MISGSYHRRGGDPGAWPAAASGGRADVCTLRPDAAVRFACRRVAGAGGAVAALAGPGTHRLPVGRRCEGAWSLNLRRHAPALSPLIWVIADHEIEEKGSR